MNLLNSVSYVHSPIQDEDPDTMASQNADDDQSNSNNQAADFQQTTSNQESTQTTVGAKISTPQVASNDGGLLPWWLLYILLPILFLALLGFLLWRFFNGRQSKVKHAGAPVDDNRDVTDDVSTPNNPNPGQTGTAELAGIVPEPDPDKAYDAFPSREPDFSDFDLDDDEPGIQSEDSETFVSPTTGFDLAAPENAEYDFQGGEQEDLLADMHREGENGTHELESNGLQLEDSGEDLAAEASDGEIDLDESTENDAGMITSVGLENSTLDSEPADSVEGLAGDDVDDLNSDNGKSELGEPKKQQFQPHDEFDLDDSLVDDEFDQSDDTEQGFDTDMEEFSLEDSGEIPVDFDSETQNAHVLDDEESDPSASDTAVGIDIADSVKATELAPTENAGFTDEPTEPFPPVIGDTTNGTTADSKAPANKPSETLSSVSSDDRKPFGKQGSDQDSDWIANAKIELEKLNRLNQDLLDDREFLNGKLQEKETTQAKLKSKLREKIQTIEQLTSELKDTSLNEEVIAVQQKQSEKERDLEVKKLQTDNDKLNAQIDSVAAELESVRSEKSTLLNELKAAIKQPSDQQTALIEQLRMELDSSKKSCTSLENKVANLTGESELLRSSITEVQKEVPESATSEIKALRDEIAQVTSQRDVTTLQLNQLMAQYRESESLIEQSKAELAKATRQAASISTQFDNAINELKSQVEKKNADLAKLQSEMAGIQSQARSASEKEAQLEALQKSASDLKSRLNSLEQDNASLATQLEAKTNAAKSDLELHQKTTTGLELEVQQWKTKAEKINGLQAELDTAQESVSNYEFELAEARQETANVVADREEKVSALQKALEREKQTTGSFELELAAYKAKSEIAAELQSKLTTAEMALSELKAIRDEQATLKQEVESLRDAEEKAKQDLATMIAVNKKLEKQIASKELKNITTQVNTLKADNAKLKQQLKSEKVAAEKLTKSKSNQLARIEAKLTKAETQIQSLKQDKQDLKDAVKSGKEDLRTAKKEASVKIAEAKKAAAAKSKSTKKVAKKTPKKTVTTKKTKAKPRKSKSAKSKK